MEGRDWSIRTGGQVRKQKRIYKHLQEYAESEEPKRIRDSLLQDVYFDYSRWSLLAKQGLGSSEL